MANEPKCTEKTLSLAGWGRCIHLGAHCFFFLLEHFAKCRISFGHRIPRKLFARRKYGFGMITGFIFCPDEHCRMLPHVAGAVDCFVCAVTDIFLSLRVTVQMFLVDGC